MGQRMGSKLPRTNVSDIVFLFRHQTIDEMHTLRVCNIWTAPTGASFEEKERSGGYVLAERRACAHIPQTELLDLPSCVVLRVGPRGLL